MEQNLEELKKEIEKKLSNMEIIVDNISFVYEGNYTFLRIILDKVNGLDLDTIVEASNIINPLVDKYDLTSDSYILDVLSKERGV